MTANTLLHSLRRATLCLCLAVCFVAVAVPARADNPPKFKDLLVAVKAKDDAKVTELNARMETLMRDGEPLKAKATPEEHEAVRAWFKTELRKLTDAGFVPPK